MGWLFVLFVLLTMFSVCTTELVITRPPRNATVLENKRFLLHCEASGSPRPRVKWFHDEEEMPRYGLNYQIRRTGTLRFREVKVSDRGKYHCKVESGKEALFSDPVYLVVEVEVTIIDYSPKSEHYVQYKSTVMLSCEAAGIPGPTIQWRKNGESIINESKHQVTIIEARTKEGYVLHSMLQTDNLTSSTKFECEAVNRHIGGPSVRSKIFNIVVLPDHDASKRTPGICLPYNGTRCASVLGTGNVFLNLSSTNLYLFDDQEKMATELLKKMHGVTTTESVQDRCDGHAEKFVCHYLFPPCKNFLDPKPVPLCRESCIAMQDLLCYVQWPVVQQSDTRAKLPICDDSLPSKRDEMKDCTEANLFERDQEEVTAECFVETGRWYNGTMNITKSGKPCQRWSSNKPQKHKRPPDVYKELENSENYCRNPGGEEVSPWCYIDSDTLGERWEICDIPNCFEESNSDDLEEEKEPSVLGWSTILIVTIVSSVGVVIIGIVAVLCYHILVQRRRAFLYKNTPQDDLEIDIQKLPANMSYHCVEEPVRLNPKLEAYEYPRNDIVYIKDIGQGAFGRVFKAKAPNLNKPGEEKFVAVKMLKEDASNDLQSDFEREASLMAEFIHPNIVKFLGVCAIGKPMCLLFEYMDKGDLNDYLRLCSPDQYIIRRHTKEIFNQDVLMSGIVDQLNISRQISAGMVYLSEKSYVHRDLATRNCLVCDNLIVKISDFGLARSIHRLDYYKGSDNDAIPIRWMPLEAILYNKFSVESDVWSFGVTLWEIFSYALQPYYGMTHEEVVEFLKEGKNLVCPENTPQQVYDIMLKCWTRKPSSRPKFPIIHKIISSLYEEVLKNQNKEQMEETHLTV